MVPAETIERAGEIGVRITLSEQVHEVTFSRTGPVGGHIRIMQAGKVLLDRAWLRGSRTTTRNGPATRGTRSG